MRTAVIKLQNSRFPLKIGFARQEVLAMQSAWTGLFCSLRSRKAEGLIISPILDKILCREGEGQEGWGWFRGGGGKGFAQDVIQISRKDSG